MASPALSFPARLVFPERSPVVCVTFFSRGEGEAGGEGTVDLQHTYISAVRYLEAQRTLPPLPSPANAADSTAPPESSTSDSPLRYELVWTDNGGGLASHNAFLRRGAQFERVVHNPTNEGLFRAVNAAWFQGRGCRAPYVLSLEDDRVARPGAEVDGAHHLALAAALLAESSSLSGVRLKNEWSDGLVEAANVDELGRELPVLVSARGLRHKMQCMTLGSGFVWGSFSLAAVLYDRLRLLREVGMMMEGEPHDRIPYDYAEGQYAVRVGLASLCTARPYLAGACTYLDHDNTPLSSPPRADEPCHQVFVERRLPRARNLDDFEWFFVGTELHASNRSALEAEGAAADGGAEGAAARGGGGSIGPSTPSTEMQREGGPRSQDAEPRPAGEEGGEVGGSGADGAATTAGTACDGSEIVPEVAALFLKLDAATRAASKSGDYAAAASVFSEMASAMGGVRAVVDAFSCAGVSQFYADHLLLQLRRPPAEPNKERGGEERPPSPSSLPAAHNWRDVPGGGAAGVIPRLIIQTWKSASLPAEYSSLVSRVRELHPDFTHLFFDDDDVVGFIRERQPSWMPLYEALTHSPIQRIDLFRYLAVEHYGGVYLDVDMLLYRPIHALLDEARATSAGAIFPFERLADEVVHPTLYDAFGASTLVGQYAFAASPRHPFLRAILRNMRRATLQPAWAMVPRPPPGDEDDDKTVHYTSGPAIVSRAYLEGGFLDSVRLLYASRLGPADRTGWSAFGPYGAHLHAGSWKRGGELDGERLLRRAEAHTAEGRHAPAAAALKRLALHGSLEAERALEVWEAAFHSSQRAGRAAMMRVELAADFGAARRYDEALRELETADALADAGEGAAARAEAHRARWLVLSQRAQHPPSSAAADEAAAGAGPGVAAAEAELEAAMRLEPSAARHRLDWAVARLRGPSAHAAEAVPELARAVEAEMAERGEESDVAASPEPGVDLPRAPAGFSYLLYMWHAAPPLRRGLSASPSIARMLRTLREPRATVGLTPCDLELGDAQGEEPAQAVGRRSTNAEPTRAVAQAEAAGGDDGHTGGVPKTPRERLVVNRYGVPSLEPS